MPQAPQPLDGNQQELVNIVRAAHGNLAIARKLKVPESARRLAQVRLLLERDAERAEATIHADLEREIAIHGSALDEAVIAAYNGGIPIRRIALDGFGNRVDSAVHEILRKLRLDGRVGNRSGYQRNTTPELDTETTVSFPAPINVHEMINEATTVQEPQFKASGTLVLVEADMNGNNGVTADAVTLLMDARDPWFRSIEKSAREGTQYRHAVSVTLYKHPATGLIVAQESREEGDVIWDHPVARWAKVNPDKALAGFIAACAAKGLEQASIIAEGLEQAKTIGDQLGINRDADQ